MNISPYRFLGYIRRAVIALTVLAALWFVFAYWRLPSPPPAPDTDQVPEQVLEWPEPATVEPSSWAVIQRRGVAAPTQVGPLAKRFRLAGTFFAYPGDGEANGGSRHAILDDLSGQMQHLVQEDDEVDHIRVVSIFRDRIVLRGQAGEEELWLSFTGASDPTREPTETARAAETPLRFEDMPALETSRFGKRIGENRWVLQRDELLMYFDELQDDPERLTAIFMAMEPDYDEEEDMVAGYQLNMLGEDVLYEAAGFQNGDIVRMVNSIPMTSPARAEYFIGEFLNERISAVVFDIERDGEEKKLIHLIR